MLFAGMLDSTFQTSWQRCDTFKRMGCVVREFPLQAYARLGLRRILRHLDREAFQPCLVRQCNSDLLAAVKASAPDILWLDKMQQLEPETMEVLRAANPRMLIVGYQDDNPFGARNFEQPFWRRYIDCIPLHDLHFIKRKEDAAVFSKRGARRVEVMLTGYYEPHYLLTGQCAGWGRSPAVFIGTNLDDRAGRITRLLLREKLDLRIYGSRWNRHWIYYCQRKHFGGKLPQGDLSGVMHRAQLALNFVSRSNHDDHNGRTFDIPASLGLLLAERTAFHSEAYEEGREAEFFSSTGECADKMRFLARHPEVRDRIAMAGHARAVRSGYSLQSRLQQALNTVNAMQ
jgi:hypothetical protein